MSVPSLRALLRWRPLYWRLVEDVLQVVPHDCRWVYWTTHVTTLRSSSPLGKVTMKLCSINASCYGRKKRSLVMEKFEIRKSRLSGGLF